MQIKKDTLVGCPVDTVWEFLADVSSVSDCIPGFELKDEIEPGVYNGVFTIRVGPIVAKLEGQGSLKIDHSSRSGAVEGKGVDRRGGSRAQAVLTYSVSAVPQGTSITVVADITLSGPLAQVGRTGIINDIADRLTNQFVAEVERRLSMAGPNEDGSNVGNQAGPSNKEFNVGNAVVSGIAGRVQRFVTGKSRS
jgi:carbon-monoxide dehydrogenase small subunit